MAQSKGPPEVSSRSPTLIILLFVVLASALLWLGYAVFLQHLGLSLISSAAAQTVVAQEHRLQGLQEFYAELMESGTPFETIGVVKLPIEESGSLQSTTGSTLTCDIFFFGSPEVRTFMVYAEVHDKARGIDLVRYPRSVQNFERLYAESEVISSKPDEWVADPDNRATTLCIEYMRSRIGGYLGLTPLSRPIQSAAP